jgi:hypothetical protein
MMAGAVLLTAVLLAAGVPSAVLLGIAPLAICLAMFLLMDREGHHTGGAERPVDRSRRAS